MSRFYGDFDPASTAQTVIATIVTNTSTCALYLPLTTDTNDDSVNNVTVTNSGVVISSAQSQFNESSAYFNSDYLTVADDTFNFGTADFTISAFLYCTGVSGNSNIFDFRTASDGFTINMNASENVGYYSNDSGSYLISQASATSIGTNSWKHFCLCRESGTTRMFIDGVLVASVSDSSDYSSIPVVVGARFTKDSQYFLGYMQDFYVIEGEALFTTAFSVPTTPGAIDSSDTRSHSHVWNYSDVYDARFANTWPVFETGPTTFSHIARFDASMGSSVDTAAGTWTSVTGTNHPTTLVNGTTATLLTGDQNGLNVVRTNSGFAVASADQVSTVTSAYAFVCIYSRNVATSASDIYPIKCGPGNNSNSIGIEIRPAALVGSHDFDIFGGNSKDREVTVAGANFSTADYTRFLIMASGNSSDGIHNVKVVVRGGTSSAVTLGTNGGNRNTAPIFLDNQARFPHANYDENIDYCEIIFYDVELSSADMITEADRLATKWGL